MIPSCSMSNGHSYSIFNVIFDYSYLQDAILCLIINENWKKKINEIWLLIFAGYVEFDSGGSQSGGEDKNSRYLTFSLWNVEVKKLHLCKTLSFVLLFLPTCWIKRLWNVAFSTTFWLFQPPFAFSNHLLPFSSTFWRPLWEFLDIMAPLGQGFN